MKISPVWFYEIIDSKKKRKEKKEENEMKRKNSGVS